MNERLVSAEGGRSVGLHVFTLHRLEVLLCAGLRVDRYVNSEHVNTFTSMSLIKVSHLH